MRGKWNDRQALKLEFFQSDIDEVKSFLNDKKVAYNSFSRKYTKGWYSEKQQYKNKILEKALEKKANEEAKNLEIPIDQLKQAKKAVIWLLMKKLQKNLEDKNAEVNVSEQERILKIIKTELGEPTNISKTDATIKGEPIDESLLIRN